eukprot:3176843-Pleurochrysis_carterae.AAC.6
MQALIIAVPQRALNPLSLLYEEQCNATSTRTASCACFREQRARTCVRVHMERALRLLMILRLERSCA